MERYIYNLVSAILLLTSILWVVYLVVASWGTRCFNLFDSYATIIIMLLEIIWSNFIKNRDSASDLK